MDQREILIIRWRRSENSFSNTLVPAGSRCNKFTMASATTFGPTTSFSQEYPKEYKTRRSAIHFLHPGKSRSIITKLLDMLLAIMYSATSMTCDALPSGFKGISLKPIARSNASQYVRSSADALCCPPKRLTANELSYFSWL